MSEYRRSPHGFGKFWTGCDCYIRALRASWLRRSCSSNSSQLGVGCFLPLRARACAAIVLDCSQRACSLRSFSTASAKVRSVLVRLLYLPPCLERQPLEVLPPWSRLALPLLVFERACLGFGASQRLPPSWRPSLLLLGLERSSVLTELCTSASSAPYPNCWRHTASTASLVAAPGTPRAQMGR